MEGVYYDGNIHFGNNTIKSINKRTDDITSLVLDMIGENGQALIFVNSRRSTEAVCRRLARPVEKQLNEQALEDLKNITKKFEASETETTSIGGNLSKLVASGVAFHHAGLADKQRKFVERNFKAGLIKCIVATPTLAAGINLPARRVIVRDVTRYDADLGVNAPISVLEIRQMMGRAGRPKYDSIGEAILLAKGIEMVDELKERYILQDTEPIYSKLSIERALRTHILAAIASGFVNNSAELEEYIGNTFYAFQSEYYKISGQIESVLTYLETEGLIIVESESGYFTATEFGRRTSSLYIDPHTGVLLRNALESAQDEEVTALAYLQIISSTPDMLTFYIRRSDYGWLETVVEENKDKFIHNWEDTDTSYDDFISQVKTACMLEDWIEERSEEFITNKYNIGPGDIRNKVDTGKWLLYSMQELARLFNDDLQKSLNQLVIRVEYGIGNELLELVSLRGIGRIRARSLFKHGYLNLQSLRDVDEKMLARIPSIGPILAKKLKEQV